MRELSPRTCILPLAVAVLALVSACKRNQNVTVTGTVVRNGQPIAVTPTGYIQVTLHPDLGPEARFTPKFAECDKATGKFEILDVPPGKYKVGVEQFDPNPQTDKLNSAFRADTGKITREIDGKDPLTIDLAKPAG